MFAKAMVPITYLVVPRRSAGHLPTSQQLHPTYGNILRGDVDRWYGLLATKCFASGFGGPRKQALSTNLEACGDTMLRTGRTFAPSNGIDSSSKIHSSAWASHGVEFKLARSYGVLLLTEHRNRRKTSTNQCRPRYIVCTVGLYGVHFAMLSRLFPCSTISPPLLYAS